MARLVTSAMNQAGTWQDEPQDQANLLAYQSNQRSREDDWRKQLAFAQLAQNQNQFDQTRGDERNRFDKSYAMDDAKTAFDMNNQTDDRADSRGRWQSEYDYKKNHDTLDFDLRNKEFELKADDIKEQRTARTTQRDEDKPIRTAQKDYYLQQAAMAKFDQEERQAERDRRKVAAAGVATLPPINGTMSPEISNEYQRNLAEMTPAEAGRIRDQRLAEQKATASSDPEFVATVQQARRSLASMIDNSTFGNWWKTRFSGLGDADRVEVENKIQPAIAFLASRGWKDNVAREAVLRQLQDEKGGSLFHQGSGVFGTNEAAIDLNKHLGLTGQ